MDPSLVQTAEAGQSFWPIVVAALGGIAVGGLVGFLTGWVSAQKRFARHAQRWTGDRDHQLAGISGRQIDYSPWNDPAFWSEEADQAFDRTRRRARREVLVGRLRRRDTCLLSFGEVVDGRRRFQESGREFGEVAISKIVGSVDKPCSFTRSFNPRNEEQRGRWKKAYAIANDLPGYQPIDLYRVGDEFFVVDGHFRVSVTKFLGGESMSAYIQEWT